MKQTLLLSVAAATRKEILSMYDMMMEESRDECCSFWILGDHDEQVIIWGALHSNRDN
jgi:hypothetical protein